MNKLKINKDKMRLILISSGSTLVLIALLIFINNQFLDQKLFQFNTSAPKNSIIRVNSEFDGMLFSMEEKLNFNTSGDKLVIYMEHYKKDKLVEKDGISVISSNKKEIKGNLIWGIDYSDDESELKLAVKKEGVTTNFSYQMKKDGAGTSSGLTQNKVRLTKDNPVILAAFANGKDAAYGPNLESGKLDKEALKKNEDSYVLWMKIEND
ncbi:MULTISPECIES: hypothetical protein [Vagococcus]|uniref:Uncharacterized protein n=1 Tax=Vagococcus fluvialis bH819 TaxID=1255619 RepID=A0A1X6WKE5_9ENTE|nr:MULTISPECIES: hypothetical protein [Vagococcus]SLM84801.1 hypothetical protein FM121_01815 [Vagococcus fluvialis bH819]HCM89739.1 hypothetical protein [Vagococcus sp.]